MILLSKCHYFIDIIIIETSRMITLNGYRARLIGSRIIESAAYCNNILLTHLYLNGAQNTSAN